MKPTASYKMSKSAKRYLATIMDPHHRGLIKKGIIDSELSQQFQPRRSTRSNSTEVASENLTD